MNAAAYFAAHPGPWLMHAPTLAAMRAALDTDWSGEAFAKFCKSSEALRAGPEPGPPPDPSDITGRPWPGYRIEDGIARIAIHGPIVNHATPLNNFMATLFGGTVLEHVRAAIEDARTNRAVRGVLLDVDSPGGEAAGTPETARLIRDLNGRKPVAAHVSGMGASAGYWLSAAAGTLIGDPASFTGSIGVVGGVVDDDEYLAKLGIKVHQYVSTQSPRKVPVPGTPEGDDELQEHVDSLADVFLADVAAYRDTTPLRVSEDFGQGGVLIASEAVKVGLIDAVGSRDDALKVLRKRIAGASRPVARTKQPAARTGHILIAGASSGRPVARLGASPRCRISS